MKHSFALTHTCVWYQVSCWLAFQSLFFLVQLICGGILFYLNPNCIHHNYVLWGKGTYCFFVCFLFIFTKKFLLLHPSTQSEIAYDIPEMSHRDWGKLLIYLQKGDNTGKGQVINDNKHFTSFSQKSQRFIYFSSCNDIADIGFQMGTYEPHNVPRLCLKIKLLQHKSKSIVLDFSNQDKSNCCLTLCFKYLFVLLIKAKCRNC